MNKMNYLFDACVAHCTTLSGMAFVRYNRFYFCHGEAEGMIIGHNLLGILLHLVKRFGIRGFSITKIEKDSEGWWIDFCRSKVLYRAGAFFDEECYHGFIGLRRRYHL